MVTWYETDHRLFHFEFVFLNLDELKTTFDTIDDDGDETKSNIPEFIEVKFFFQAKSYIIMK